MQELEIAEQSSPNPISEFSLPYAEFAILSRVFVFTSRVLSLYHVFVDYRIEGCREGATILSCENMDKIQKAISQEGRV